MRDGNIVRLPSVRGGSIAEMADAMGWRRDDPGSLPFTPDDITMGTETELQTAVRGHSDSVDLPISIEESHYLSNLRRRTAAGDTPMGRLADLERHLRANREGIWENSWVRFEANRLSAGALAAFDRDLRSDRHDPSSLFRRDKDRFSVQIRGQQGIRIPASYALKLSLVDAISLGEKWPVWMRQEAARLTDHFLSDNTSPETISFHVSRAGRSDRMWRPVAEEKSLRYLLTQLLAAHANEQWGLRESGQELLAYLSASVPHRQKRLAEMVPDAFYRELFMNPCLSGWRRGEDKLEYMNLCHRVLTRSHLNGLAKLHEAGVFARRRISFPSLSTVSLANNGTHLTIGSRSLSAAMASGDVSAAAEKNVGDLVTKIVEHFLPLSVGTLSAAPRRISFEEFLPEHLLGFLAHELDYTHLRMLWRRWQKKKGLTFVGQPITPTGVPWADRLRSLTMGLSGDFVPDFRLVDYLVSVLGTPRSQALNGQIGNTSRLKSDLSQEGVFDPAMSIYLLMRQREHATHGFCGFEGRHYSVFHDLQGDLALASGLQSLITAFAFKLVSHGVVTHHDIPDTPEVESERRQVFFSAAVGIPNVFVRQDTPNVFLRSIIAMVPGSRDSHRYAGYWRIPVREYSQALIRMLTLDGADLVEMMAMRESLTEIGSRIEDPTLSAAGRMTSDIGREIGVADPHAVSADRWNASAERYFQTSLRNRHVVQALQTVGRELSQLASTPTGGCILGELSAMVNGECIQTWVNRRAEDVVKGRVSAADIRTLIAVVVAVTTAAREVAS